ncbi:hypothetical protein niasHT_032377 [Heterodera trifolii]|uniref:Uncharacterized protein n=1 Tax=Heterodera trifolii TaxID=157864 RepID=A0ABD2HVF7_9BILA
MIKNLKNLFKPPTKRREKENEDPFLLANTHSSHFGGGQRRTHVGRSILQRRVNFRGQQQGEDFDQDQDSEDGGSEVTLTTAANEPHHGRQALPNPYSVVTEPKKNRGPRSCPGGGRAFDLDEELLSHRSGGRGGTRRGGALQQQQFLDDSLLDTRSEFIAPPQQQRQQHRRSCRRRAVPAANGDEPSQQQQQQPLREIGNNGGGGGGRAMSSRRLSVADFYPFDANRHHLSVVSSASSRYKNVPPQLTERQTRKNFSPDEDSGADWEIWNLNRLYHMERAKRKEIQQKLRSQLEDNELLRNQYNTLWLNYNYLLARQQQTQQQNAASVFPPNFPTFPSDLLDYGGGIFNSWNGGTPSSSSAVPSTPAGATNAMRPPAPTIGLPAHLWPPPSVLPSAAALPAPNAVLQQQRNGGGAGEQLASLFSAVSIDQQQQLQLSHNEPPIGHHRRQQSAPPPIPPREHNGTAAGVSGGRGNGGGQQQHHAGKLNGDKGVAAGIEEEEDELKDFRRGQHNTDSFSGSSRPTTGELREMEQLKEDLVTDSSKESHHNTTPADDDDERQAISDSSSFPPNYSSLTTPEAARGGGASRKNNGTFLGTSFSADPICAAGGVAFALTDSPTPPPKDDGYATSETNLSEMGTSKEEKQSRVVGMHRSKSLE